MQAVHAQSNTHQTAKNAAQNCIDCGKRLSPYGEPFNICKCCYDKRVALCTIKCD